MTTQYVYPRPTSAFTSKGLLGYTFGPLRQKDVDLYYVDVEKGHDTFMVSRKITRTYYILSGEGYFTIDDRKYTVGPEMVVEVPPGVEYTYSGKMKLFIVSRPRWFRGNDTFTRWNPDVVGSDRLQPPDPHPVQTRLVKWRIFGRSPVTVYLLLNRWVWHRLPAAVTGSGPMRTYGKFLNFLAERQVFRSQAFSTFFLRNRPQLELIRRLAERSPRAAPLKVAVLGCSIGAEAYSIAWTIRSARPDGELGMNAVDISRHAVEVAEGGTYSLVEPQLTSTNIVDRMTAAEIDAIFDRDGDVIRVKPWIRDGITWSVGDVDEPEIVESLGLHDIVVANNFLCHMDPPTAERCLLNIARVLKPGGYIFVSGIDLAVRTKVAKALGWTPLQELLEEIHEGDSCMRDPWPFQYPSLEPLEKRRRDWNLRYAAAFRAPPSATVRPEPAMLTVCA
jgi:chemotaxis methyl-accepting protein methylase